MSSCVDNSGAGEPSDTDEATTLADEPDAGGSTSTASKTTHDAGASSSHAKADAAATPATTPAKADAGKAADPAPVVDAGKGGTPEPDAGKADAGKADAGKPVADAGGGGGSTNACDSLTYDSFGKAFLDKYCTNCHGGVAAQSGVSLDTLAGVQANKARSKSEVANSSMPPFFQTAPTAAERQQFGAWIDCGPK